jgi:hypothetical protein
VFCKKKGRYFHNKDAQKFLNTVLATSEARRRLLKKGSILWRAQIGYDWEPVSEVEDEWMTTYSVGGEPHPLPTEKMKPITREASEGRANPKGIPYLYLSTNKKTAMSEVRPWVGSLISVGQFKITKDLVLIDTSSNNDKLPVCYFQEPEPEEIELTVWKHINGAFSKPMAHNDQVTEYVPTQIIAELFRNAGLDGILYRSMLGKGSNIVLFDLEVAELIDCSLHEITALSLSFKEAEDPYF